MRNPRTAVRRFSLSIRAKHAPAKRLLWPLRNFVALRKRKKYTTERVSGMQEQDRNQSETETECKEKKREGPTQKRKTKHYAQQSKKKRFIQAESELSAGPVDDEINILRRCKRSLKDTEERVIKNDYALWIRCFRPWTKQIEIEHGEGWVCRGLKLKGIWKQRRNRSTGEYNRDKGKRSPKIRRWTNATSDTGYCTTYKEDSKVSAKCQNCFLAFLLSSEGQSPPHWNGIVHEECQWRNDESLIWKTKSRISEDAAGQKEGAKHLHTTIWTNSKKEKQKWRDTTVTDWHERKWKHTNRRCEDKSFVWRQQRKCCCWDGSHSWCT